MRQLLVVLSLLGMLGCQTESGQPTPPPKQVAKKIEPPDPYQEYVHKYQNQARIVKRGQPFLNSDGQALAVGDQPVYFQGIDEYNNVVYQYENVTQFRGRTVSHPIIMPGKVELVKNQPRPLGTIIGDLVINQRIIRVLAASHDQCSYVLENPPEK